MRYLGQAAAMAVACAAAAGCATTTFGRVVTEVTVSPDRKVLLVRSCELTAGKSTAEQVELGDCKRNGVRRSPILPVPVIDATVIARDQRIVTGIFERPQGGAVVTTCRIGMKGEGWALLDCAKTELATAPVAGGGTP